MPVWATTTPTPALRTSTSSRAARNIQVLSLTPDFSSDAQKTTAHAAARRPARDLHRGQHVHRRQRRLGHVVPAARPGHAGAGRPVQRRQLERDASSRQRGHRGHLERDRHPEPGRRPDLVGLGLAARARRHRRPGVAPRRAGRRRQRHLDRHRRRPLRHPRRDVVHGVPAEGDDVDRRGNAPRRGHPHLERARRPTSRSRRSAKAAASPPSASRTRTRTSRTPSTRRSTAARISSRRTTSRSPRRASTSRTARPSTRRAGSSPAPTPTRPSRWATTSRRRSPARSSRTARC